MNDIESYLTPYKYGKPILAPSGIKGEFDCYGADNARIFRHHGKIYLMYIGFDGEGYQTALATTEDMVNFKKLGVILGKDKASKLQKGGRAVSCLLCDVDLYGNRNLIKVDNKYWLFYHAYPEVGYEAGSAANYVAWAEDESLLNWHCTDEPVFQKGNAGQWDSGGLYSMWVIQTHDGYRMYYNGKTQLNWPWLEQVGMATSQDFVHWKRYENNPIFKVTPGRWDSAFACGQHVLYDSRKKRWVMFYCGYDGKTHAMEGVAISDDGIHFEKHPEPIIKSGKRGELDGVHAHKPCVFYHHDTLYHIYCAVREALPEEKERFGREFRCLTIAASKPFEY
jgi:predicted GH43/DUF377 family glycosyl hydrolase